MTALPAEAVKAAKEAHRYADELERQILSCWPGAWQDMDRLRKNPPMDWPEWCLLPMAAAVAAVSSNRRTPGLPPPYAVVSALYAWRYSRAVYVMEPSLMDRLLTQVPDMVSLDALTGLPHWCVYITGEHPEWPGAGLWAHLEHDAKTGRPELRLLLDTGGGLGEQIPIPVYLDRPSVTEALADFRGTAALTAGGVLGANVRGAALDATAAEFGERIDSYLGVLMHLARPEADIQCHGRPGVQPVRPRSPMRDRTTWAVGYGGS